MLALPAHDAQYRRLCSPLFSAENFPAAAHAKKPQNIPDMKLSIVALIGLVAATLNAQTPTCTPFEQEDFNSPSSVASWTPVDAVDGNGSIKISGSAITFSNADTSPCSSAAGACNGRELRLWRRLSHPLSNSSWRAECKFQITNGNGVAHTLLGFTAGNLDPEGTRNGCILWTCSPSPCSGFTATAQNGIFASIIAFGNDQLPSSFTDKPFVQADQDYDANNVPSASEPPTLGWRIFGHAKRGAGAFYPNPVRAASDTQPPPLDFSRGISLPKLNTDYYLRLERLSATSGMISIFSDAAMQNHVVGSPQCFEIEPEIVDLTVVQNAAHTSGAPFRAISGTVDDFRIFDAFAQCPGASNPCQPTATPACATIAPRPRVTCNQGTFSYTMTVTNNSPQTIQYLLFSPPPGQTYIITPSFLNLGTNPLGPGQSTTVTVTISNVSPGQHVCVNVTLADNSVRPCCTVQTCTDLPDCPCLTVKDFRPGPVCTQNGYTYTVTLTNPMSTPVHQIFVVPTSPANVHVMPSLINLTTPLNQNQSTTVTFTITGAPPGNVCLRFSPLGENGAMCCSTEHCFNLPSCGPPFPDTRQSPKPRKK